LHYIQRKEITGLCGPPYLLVDLPNDLANFMALFLKWMGDYEPTVLFHLFRPRGKGCNEVSTVEAAKDLIYKNFEITNTQRVILPSMKTERKEGSPNLFALLLVVATTACDQESAMYLEDCINKDWMVSIHEDSEQWGAGTAAVNLHPGTFVCHEMKTSWYYPELYTVSN
jgi:hypothetical protein